MHTSLLNSLVVLIIMKMLCQDFLEVNNALEIVYTGLMNNVVVLIIMKKLYQELLEVNNANLADVHTTLINSLVVLIK